MRSWQLRHTNIMLWNVKILIRLTDHPLILPTACDEKVDWRANSNTSYLPSPPPPQPTSSPSPPPPPPVPLILCRCTNHLLTRYYTSEHLRTYDTFLHQTNLRSRCRRHRNSSQGCSDCCLDTCDDQAGIHAQLHTVDQCWLIVRNGVSGIFPNLQYYQSRR